MENENQEVVETNEGTLGTVGDIEIVDTSNPNYQKEAYGIGAGDSSIYDAPNDEPVETGDNNNEPPAGGDNQEPASTGNQYFDAYKEWASERGLEIDDSKFDLENFNEEMLEEQVGRYYFEKYADKTDPRIKQLIENRVDLNQYVQQQQQLQQFVQAKPVDVYKANLYNHLYNELGQQGVLKVDQNNQLTQDSMQYLQQQVEERAKLIGEEEMIKRGQQMQAHYQQELEGLPQKIQQQQMEQYKQQVDTYNQEVGQLVESYEKTLKNAKTLVTDFSGQPEKDDFLKYVKENLSAVEDNGQYKTPFLHKIQNDDEYLMKMLRLSYLYENGYFTDLKNATRKESFEKLGMFPKLGKGKSNKKGGSTTTANGIEIMDTSDPDYQSNYLK
jgi:hypothetical protein